MVVGVYGLGRFGAFWAECLAKRFVVKGYSRNPERTVDSRVQRVTEDEVLSCDALFLCVAISAMEEVLERIASRVQEHTVVFDTCSVKVVPVDLMESILPDSVRVIGTHPMFGPDSGRDGIDGLPLCFSPVRVSESVADRWRTIFLSMGLRLIELTPDAHDREAAYTQGVTHFIGRVLENLELAKSEIGTVGYAKLLEIVEQTCNDPFQLFLDLQRYNPYTDGMRDRLSMALERVRRSLELDTAPSPHVE